MLGSPEEIARASQGTCGHTIDGQADQGDGAYDDQEVEHCVAAQVLLELQHTATVDALLGLHTATTRTKVVALGGFGKLGCFAEFVRSRKLWRRLFAAQLDFGFGSDVHYFFAFGLRGAYQPPSVVSVGAMYLIKPASCIW